MLLDISNLNLWFNESSASGQLNRKQVLFDVSLQADTRQTVAVVGESGSGKSVTALTILRLLEETSNVTTQGSILFENRELLQLPSSEIRSIRGNRISMIFQEPMSSLNPVFSVGNQLVEPLMQHQGLNRREAEKEAISMLGKSGITDPETRMKVFPHQLSGGQRQRVMIAMALGCRPKLLIADEPTTALDVTIQAQILDLITELQQEYNMAVLLISHDLIMVEKFADSVFIMKDGNVVESGACTTILNAPTHPYTKHLLSSISSSLSKAKPSSPTLLSINNLQCSFKLSGGSTSFFKARKRTLKAVDKVSLQLEEGKTCGIIGESGSGKSTLAMAILRLIKSEGDILFQDTNLQTLSLKQMRSWRKDIQVVFQDPYSSLSPRLTVFQIIEEGLKIHYKNDTMATREQKVIKALQEVGLRPEMGARYPHEFSGGQRQRIAIARAIILQPKLLILDEPTSALDVTIQAQILELLQKLQQQYAMSYLFISHDLRVIRSISDTIAVMQHGKIIEQGTAEQIFTSPEHHYTKTLFDASIGA